MTEREQKLFDSLIKENKLFLHKDFKVNQKRRKGKIMSLEEFEISFNEFCERRGMSDTYEIFYGDYFKNDQEVLFNDNYEVDWENIGILSCGVPWVLYAADSFLDRLDFPVYFFLYPDGETGNPRMYIPTRGNIFHKDLKVAYDSSLSGLKKKMMYLRFNGVSNDEVEKEGLRGIIKGSDLSNGYSKSEIENVVKEFQNNSGAYGKLYDLLDYDTGWMINEFEDRVEGI
jgi:hypothetical protein